MSRGRFITVEGIEGTGKSTNIDFITGLLEARGITVVTAREPGGTQLGERLREILLDPETGKISGDAELLMMFASRAQHIDQVIEPALRAGRWVVSDRFTDASFAYQGGGRGIPMETINRLADWVHGDVWPDLTILLDADVLFSGNFPGDGFFSNYPDHITGINPMRVFDVAEFGQLRVAERVAQVMRGNVPERVSAHNYMD